LKRRIFYLVPESIHVPAGGILTLLTHVAALNRIGCEAYAVSERPLVHSWAHIDVPQRRLADVAREITKDDVIIIPEGNFRARENHFARAVSAVLIALSYRYIPEHQLRSTTLAEHGFTHILTPGRATKAILSAKRYTAGLPINVVRESLGSCLDLFYPEPNRRVENSVLVLANKNVLHGYVVHFVLRQLRVRGSIPNVPIRIVSDLNQAVFAEMVRASDIVVVPYTREGFGRVPLEAMLADCTVVTYQTSGADYLRNEENALVAADNRADVLIKSVLRLIRDDSLKARLRQGGSVTTPNYSQQMQDRDLQEFFRLLGCL
jgi:hypothetical protein